MKLRLAPLLAILLGGCAPQPLVTAQVPAGVEWAALLELSEGGALIGASALFRWDPGAGLPVIARGGVRTVVAGFGAVAGAPSSSALRAAEGCEARLPAPVWIAEIGEGRLAPSQAAVPALTADWLDAACPEVDPATLLIDDRCASAACDPVVRRTEGCGIEVDLGACEGGKVPGRITPEGGVCLDFRGNALACEPAASAGAYLCNGGCALQVHRAPASPPFEQRSIALVRDVPVYVPADLRRNGLLLPREVFSGYLYDLIVLSDQVVISRSLGEVAQFCPARNDPESRLDFVDLETMAVVRTATAPPCLAAMDADARGGGFYGVFGDARRRWMVGRFDARGRIVRQAELDPRDPATIGERDPRKVAYDQFQPIAARVIGGALLVAMARAQSETPGGVVVAAFALDTLQNVNGGDKRTGSIWAAESDGARALYLGDDSPPSVHVIDAAPFGERTTVVLPQRTLSERVAVASVLPLANQVWAASPYETASVLRAGGSSEARVTLPFGRRFSPVRLAAWPKDGLLLAAGTAQGDGATYDAVVALFDPTAPAFLPGTWKVGAGTVGRIQKDRLARLWLMLPWSAEVVRLTPR